MAGKKPTSRSTTTSTTLRPKQSSSFHFPTSPDAGVPPGDGQGSLYHSAHPQHPLAKISSPQSFSCMACKEPGAGTRFACLRCDFQLHEFCALSPPVLKNHPLHFHHQLHLCSKPSGGILWAKCDICKKAIKGNKFKCEACDFRLHPCCAMFSAEMSFPSHPHNLRLLPAQATVRGSSNPAICGECQRLRKSGDRAFYCMVCDYQLDIACAKNMVNGLHENGYGRFQLEKPRNRQGWAARARVASHAVVELVGSFMEGFGEGVGQALLEDETRGRGRVASISTFSVPSTTNGNRRRTM